MDHQEHTLYAARFETPLGTMYAVADERALVSLTYTPVDAHVAHYIWQCNHILMQLAQELSAYFDGTLTHFTIPIHLKGTPFQEEVWHAIRTIEYADVASYAAIAAFIGKPQSVRAVANACGANPCLLVVGCHRVTRSDGDLGGYAAGVDRKRKLLALEMHGV